MGLRNENCQGVLKLSPFSVSDQSGVVTPPEAAPVVAHANDASGPPLKATVTVMPAMPAPVVAKPVSPGASTTGRGVVGMTTAEVAGAAQLAAATAAAASIDLEIFFMVTSSGLRDR